jgi:hypothetical protein
VYGQAIPQGEGQAFNSADEIIGGELFSQALDIGVRHTLFEDVEAYTNSHQKQNNDPEERFDEHSDTFDQFPHGQLKDRGG